MPLLVVGGVEVDEPLERAIAIEDLDAPVPPVGDVEVVLAVDPDVVRRVELRRVLVGMSAAAAARCPTM